MEEIEGLNTDRPTLLSVDEVVKKFGPIGAMQVFVDGENRKAIKGIETVVLNHKNDKHDAQLLLISKYRVYRVTINEDKKDFTIRYSKLDECFDKDGHQLVDDNKLVNFEHLF